MASVLSSYRKIYRLIFAVFFLYLLGDAFYRWDAARLHSTFSEFLLGIALTSILMSILAALVTLLFLLSVPLINLLYSVFQWIILRVMHNVKAAQVRLFVFILLSLSAIVWVGKKLTTQFSTSLQLKVFVLLCIIVAALFMSFLLREKAQKWIDTIKTFHSVIQDRITPVVWMFASWVFISVLLVSYQMSIKSEDKMEKQDFILSSEPNEIRPNIVLVTYDALTARHMSSYGYSKDTTPFIREWAKEASVFTKAKASSNWTASTTASLLQGKRVWLHRRFSRMGESRPVGNNLENMPYLLKKYGYYNMAFITNSIASVDKLKVADFFDVAAPPSSMYRYANIIDCALGLASSTIDSIFGTKIKFAQWIFHEDFILLNWIHLTSRKKAQETQFPPEKAYNKFLNTLAKTAHRPFFVWIHIMPPHSPYLPPEPFKGIFDPSDQMRTYESVETGFAKAKESILKHNRVPHNFNTLVARYDEFIRYCDSQFEDFILKLKKMNNINNTIVLLSADHGEIFSNKGLGHGDTLYESEINIPLIIREINAPRRFNGRVIAELVEQIDIPATILELGHIPVPKWMDGRSLLPLMKGDTLPPRPGFSMMLERNRSLGNITKGVIAIWDGDYKLIHNFEDQTSLLFNMSEDPHEEYNLFDKETETGRHLLTMIQNKIREANERLNKEK